MAVNVKDKQENEKEVSIEPVVLTSVKIRYVDKTIEVPNFISVNVEVPNFIKKDTTEYIRHVEPTFFYIKEERPYPVDVPVPKEVPYDLPVVSMEKVNEIASDVISVITEAKILLGGLKTYKVKEEEYIVAVPVPKEVPYDLPVVSMERVNQVAAEALSTLGEAKTMLKEINGIVAAYSGITNEINATMKEIKARLAEVKNYEIVTEKYTVKVPELIKEKITVVGKIIARESM